MNMQNAFSAVDKAPLAGKFAIRGSIRAYAEAGLKNPEQNPKEAERHQLQKTLGYLALMVTGHAVQAKLGVDSFMNHAENLQETGDRSNLGYLGIDSMYTFVNAAVTARQVDLTGRVLKMRKKKSPKIEERMKQFEEQQTAIANRKKVPWADNPPLIAPWADKTPLIAPWENNPIPEEAPEKKKLTEQEKAQVRKLLAAVAITLGGQVLFLHSLSDGIDKESQSVCYDFAQEQIVEYENIHGDVLDEAYEKQYSAELCEPLDD